MGRREDDEETPLQHRHDAEGAQFRRWREHHPGGSWERFERDRRQPSASSEPLSPEAAQRAFRRDHDTGDLDAEERAQLAIGIAPALTPWRILVRFGGVLGMVLMLTSMWIGRGLLWVSVPLGLVGLGLFLFALFGPTGGRSKTTQGRRRR